MSNECPSELSRNISAQSHTRDGANPGPHTHGLY